MPDESDFVDPTPEEIAERCLQVQATWDERTRKARMWGVGRYRAYRLQCEADYIALRRTGGEMSEVVDGEQ